MATAKKVAAKKAAPAKKAAVKKAAAPAKKAAAPAKKVAVKKAAAPAKKAAAPAKKAAAPAKKVQSPEEILAAIPELGKCGIFAEPAGSTAYAGMLKALQQGLVQPADRILVINTGSGLKDVKAAMQSVPPAPVIEPSLQALKRMLQ